MSDYVNYDEAIQAILDAQTDVDNKYKSIGDASSTLCDVNQTMVQIPDASVVRNRGGEVIGYDYKYTTPKLPDIGIIAVDSNTDSGTFGESEGGGGHSSGGAGRYRGSYYAGEVDNDPQSTNKMKGSGLVSGVVSAAWAAGSVLSKLGKTVASITADTLEEVDAHFGVNFGPLNVDFGYGTADMANAVRALFGVDNQGNTTMYLEEDVIGALAIQTRDDGFFDNGLIYPTGNVPALGENVTFNPTIIPIYEGMEFIRSSDNYKIVIYDCNLHGDLVSLISIGGGVFAIPVAPYRNTNLGSFKIRPYRPDGTPAAAATNIAISSYNFRGADGVTYYVNRSNFVTLLGGSVPFSPPVGWSYLTVNGEGDANVDHFAYELQHAEEVSPIPGLSDQTGATIPVDAITGADPHVVAQNLESNYPQLMGTPVQIVVMDDSCNEIVKNYYSVPISYSPTNLNINAPITGGLQVSPSFNPDVQLDLPDINMDNYIDQIIKILGGSGAGQDVTTEPVPDEPDTPSSEIGDTGVSYDAPDTGTGETPPTTDPVVAVESMWHIYHALPAQLSALGQWLWSANIIDQIVRTFQNPMEAIMGVHALYVQPPFSSSQVPIVVGNLTSNANAFPLTGQYQALDCGYVWLTEYFGNVFDYDPFTEVSLYLPFVGIVKLDTADVMRAKISVIYGIDCYTGACLAKVSVNRDGAGGVLYEYPGNCAVEYPVSGASYSRMLQSIVAAGMSAVAVGMKTGGAPGTEALGAAAAGATFLGSGEKISVQRAGSLGGNAGVMGAKIPYLIVSRPQPNTAYLFPHYQGIPVNKTVKVSECSGFQRFESIHLKCPFAYKEELEEIEMLLKKGILI